MLLSYPFFPFAFSHAFTRCGIYRELNVSYLGFIPSVPIPLFSEHVLLYFNYLSQSCLYLIIIKKPNLDSYSF